MSSEAASRAVDVDGVAVEAIVEPRSVDALRDELRVLSRDGARALIVGGGTRLAYGNLGGPFDVALSTAKLNEIIHYEPDDLTLAVEPGCTVGQAHELLSAHGQQMALDVAHPTRATIGGAYATGLSGPRRLGGGSLKDWVIGVEVAGPDGVLARAGGMVVKNVTGFDMMHVHYGALGALGVVTRVNLKVFPKPDAERTLSADYASAGEAYSAGTALLRSQLQPSALLIANNGGWRLRARFDGPLAAIDRLTERALAVCRDAASSTREDVAADGAAALAPFTTTVDLIGNAAVARLACPVSRQLPLIERLGADDDVELCADLGSGLVYARLSASAASLALVDAADAGVSWLAAPAWFKAGRDVFGALDPCAGDVARSLKAAFDPVGRLIYGRWVLGL